MRLRKNMKRTAAAVLALSMAVSAAAMPASAGYTIDMSDEKITGNVEIKQETDGSGTKITISVDGKDRTTEFTDDEAGDKITITGDNTVTKPAAATTADAEAAKDDTKAPETTVEENKDGTVIDYTGKQDAQPEQEASRPEGAAPDMEADPAGVDDQQEETDPEADKDDPDGQNDQNNQSGQNTQNTQNEDSEDEDADAGIMTYEAPAPTTLTSAVAAAARKVISIINNATGKELAVTLKNLKVDAGNTAENAVTVSGTGDVTLELEGKNELKGGSGYSEENYGGSARGICIAGDGKHTIQGKEGSSLSATGGAGNDKGGWGIYAWKLNLVDATVTATGGAGGGAGIYVGGDNFNIENSKLTARGGGQQTVGDDASAGGGYGIRIEYAKVIVGEGSEVIAIGGSDKAVNRGAGGGEALDFYYGGGYEVQKGGKLTAIGGNAESENGKATGGNALWGERGGIVSAGETTLIGGNAKSGSGEATGGDAITGDSNYFTQVTVKEGTFTAAGGKAEGADGKATNGNSVNITPVIGNDSKTQLEVEEGGTFVTAKPGNSDENGNGITGKIEINTAGGKIEEVENAKVVKKEDGTVEVVGDVVGVETGNLKYELTATVEPTCTTPGKRVYTCTTKDHEGEIYEEIISDALGHHFVNGVCTRCGAPEQAAAENGSSSAVTLTVTGAGAYETSIADGRYIVAVPAETAVLSGCLSNLKELKAQGADTIVFRTQLRETALNIDSMLSLGVDDTLFTLTHSGESAELTVGGFAHNELLH